MGGQKEDGSRTRRKGRFEKGCAENVNRFFVDVHILVFPLFSSCSPCSTYSPFHFFPFGCTVSFFTCFPCHLLQVFTPLFRFHEFRSHFYHFPPIT